MLNVKTSIKIEMRTKKTYETNLSHYDINKNNVILFIYNHWYRLMVTLVAN